MKLRYLLGANVMPEPAYDGRLQIIGDQSMGNATQRSECPLVNSQVSARWSNTTSLYWWRLYPSTMTKTQRLRSFG